LEASLGALDQQIALKLGHGTDDAHHHPIGRAGQVRSTKLQAVHSDAHRCQLIDSRPDIHGVAAQPIEARNDQNVICLKPVKPGAGPLPRCRRAASLIMRFVSTLNPAISASRTWFSVV
jgi:hypothetical protein